MKIVIDTNVVISAIFFGGNPRKVVEAVLDEKLTACANQEIIDEYLEIIEEMIKRKQGNLDNNSFTKFISRLEIKEQVSHDIVSRDPEDDKFINCALDTKSLFIVSGDNDLLVLKKYKDIEIITAQEFCKKYLH